MEQNVGYLTTDVNQRFDNLENTVDHFRQTVLEVSNKINTIRHEVPTDAHFQRRVNELERQVLDLVEKLNEKQ